MVDDAFKAMREAIDGARRDGYRDGYAAALKAVTDFVASASPSTMTTKEESPSVDRAKVPKGRLGSEEFTPRIPHGLTREMVESAYRSIAPRVAGPTEIQHIIARENEANVPFTSVRRAIDRLEQAGKIQEIPGTKTWRYITEAPGSDVPGAPSASGVVPLRR
jgi:hypothetical protein